LRRFSLAIKLRCLSTSLAVLSTPELSSVALPATIVAWEAWEARETMLMSMPSLEMPLVRDPVILMSFLRFVQKIMGSTRTWTARGRPPKLRERCQWRTWSVHALPRSRGPSGSRSRRVPVDLMLCGNWQGSSTERAAMGAYQLKGLTRVPASTRTHDILPFKALDIHSS
jgi:hypothetical protein